MSPVPQFLHLIESSPIKAFTDHQSKLLKLPVLVVAANRLGAINHLLLTLEHASCRGLRVLGYVLNQVASESSLATETNRDALLSLTAVPCVGEIPYIRDLETRHAPLSDVIEEKLDLRLVEMLLRIS